MPSHREVDVGEVLVHHPRLALLFLKISSTHRITSVSPAVVFFPQGTYLVSSPIIAYYYTQLIGDARVPPTLLASPSFAGMAVIGELYQHPISILSLNNLVRC